MYETLVAGEIEIETETELVFSGDIIGGTGDSSACTKAFVQARFYVIHVFLLNAIGDRLTEGQEVSSGDGIEIAYNFGEMYGLLIGCFTIASSVLAVKVTGFLPRVVVASKTRRNHFARLLTIVQLLNFGLQPVATKNHGTVMDRQDLLFLLLVFVDGDRYVVGGVAVRVAVRVRVSVGFVTVSAAVSVSVAASVSAKSSESAAEASAEASEAADLSSCANTPRVVQIVQFSTSDVQTVVGIS